MPTKEKTLVTKKEILEAILGGNFSDTTQLRQAIRETKDLTTDAEKEEFENQFNWCSRDLLTSGCIRLENPIRLLYADTVESILFGARP